MTRLPTKPMPTSRCSNQRHDHRLSSCKYLQLLPSKLLTSCLYLQERGYAHGQKMGHSNIIFGDAGGEPTIGGKKIKPKVSRNYPNNQAFGASNIVGSGVSAGGAGAPQPKSRTYPGGQTFGYSQVSSSIVPPELPRPKVVTKMGQSSLTLNGAPRSESPERKPAKAASVPLGQRMGHSNLGAGGVPTEKPKAPVKPSKMLESSADPRAFQHPVRRKKPFYKPADPAVEEPEEEAEEVLGVQVTEPYPVPNWQKMDKGSKLRWAHRNPDKWDAYVAKR
mmetsp:Transcript_64669/g.145880  ORF Transcript_64669/g.145880 Transcript_64669/m.145880 type:complete len:278 (-) Transcript_64669:214-1047(-)